MRALFLVSACCLVACKKDPPPIAPPSPVAERKSPLVDVVKAPGVLSVFEPVKDHCEWRRVDTASKRSATVARFPGTCIGARVAWNPDGQTAAVWFDPELVQRASIGGSAVGKPGFADETVDAAAKHQLFSVNVATGVVKPVAFPGVKVEELGVDAKGEVVALSLQELDEATVAAKKVVVDGKELVLTEVNEGLPALAHAWIWTGEMWKRVETVQTTTGWDYGPGVRDLTVMASLGPRSSALLETHPGDSSEVDEPMLKKLAAFAPKLGDGSWTAYGTTGARVFAWCITAEFAYTTGLLVFEGPTLRTAQDIGFTDGELIAVRNEGPFLLVSSGDAGAHPRVYERSTGALRYSSDTARAVTFWP